MRFAAAVALLALLPAVASAYAPSAVSRPAFSANSLRLSAVATGPGGKPAASAEEDLELTYRVILEKIAADEEEDDDDAAVEDEVDEDEVEAIASVEDEEPSLNDDDDEDEVDVVEAEDSPLVAEFQSLLRTRRTINDFETTLPPGWEDAVNRAIEAATHAPNHKRTEPWRFHLLGPDAVRNVCELNAALVSAKKGEEAGRKKFDRWLKMPGWLVATCVVEEGKGKGKDDSPAASSDDMDGNPAGLARENYAAVCCAVQNLCLSLHAEGIGTKWTTGPVNFDERFGEAAGVPEDEYVVGTMWFGTAAKVPDAPRKRLSLEDVLTRHD